MAKPRLVPAGLVFALLVMMAAPCFAYGPGEPATMACCLAGGEGGGGNGGMTQACCRTSDATQHDRDVQPPTIVMTHLAQASASRVHDAAAPLASRLHGSLPHDVLVALSPPRHTPLLI
jgi:hypothetical protein